jgi:hypothetical protein
VVRTQIQLTEEESTTLKAEARRRGVSVAELIRQSVDRFLEEARRGAPQNVGRLAALGIIGRFHSDFTDISVRHDDYLDEAYLPAQP